MRSSAALSALIALTGTLTACASRPAVQQPSVDPFDQADYAAAVADYEQRVQHLVSVESDPDLVLRLALARAVEGHLGHDTDRARELLQELARTSSVRGEASAIVRILDSLEAAEQRLAVLEPEAARSAEVLLELVGLVTAYLEETSELRQTIENRERSLSSLRQRLRAAEAEAARLASELEELKSIDLSRPE